MESKNAVENKPKTVTFGDKTLVKQIETRREEQRLKEAQRKSIHESICELIEDEITEEILRKNVWI
jgi:hypothetical protein